MKMEIKGFNEASKISEAIETMKKIERKANAKKVNELVAMGIDRELAKTMVKCGACR